MTLNTSPSGVGLVFFSDGEISRTLTVFVFKFFSSFVSFLKSDARPSSQDPERRVDERRTNAYKERGGMMRMIFSAKALQSRHEIRDVRAHTRVDDVTGCCVAASFEKNRRTVVASHAKRTRFPPVLSRHSSANCQVDSDKR